MTRTVDLNADMGESFGDWTMGNDAALLDIVTSANIACGFHAGDPDVMAKTMGLAVEKNVGIGAHPGFADLQGFGRRRMTLPAESLKNTIRYQLGAAQAMAKSVGGSVRHFKLHGALSNMAAQDPDMAKLCFQAALDISPDIVIVVQAATAMDTVVRGLGCHWAGEIFADRAYNDDATLVDRALPGAVIHDADVAAERVLNMIKAGAIISRSGAKIAARIDTVCLHGDTEEAVTIATKVRSRLHDDCIDLRVF
ncbi:MAG: 5-oxoprolinase subunit PxpA [Marinosulfonomonas sp.]|nr:5-oxoprolinase subunit PxpA [Marinosulfonomonas sp.]